MTDEIKRRGAKRKTALILAIIEGETTEAEAHGAYDLPQSQIDEWVEDGKRSMEDANTLGHRNHLGHRLATFQSDHSYSLLRKSVSTQFCRTSEAAVSARAGIALTRQASSYWGYTPCPR
jgi:hypothetical protein